MKTQNAANVKNKYSMKRILEQIIDRNTEGNYLLSSSDKAQMISEILDLLGVVGRSEQCVLHSTDWHGKCFKCGEQIFIRESK